MSIDISEVVVGGVYSTANNQERRITKIVGGNVYYKSRGGNANNDWSPGHTLANPPSIASFAEACDQIKSIP